MSTPTTVRVVATRACGSLPTLQLLLVNPVVAYRISGMYQRWRARELSLSYRRRRTVTSALLCRLQLKMGTVRRWVLQQ